MSSMFRSPNDVSSDPQEDSDGVDDDVEPSPAPLQLQESASESIDGGASRVSALPDLETFGVAALSPHKHGAVITSSLLEFHCHQRAAEVLNQRAGVDNLYSRFSPEAIALGKQLYERQSRTLSSQGVLPPNLEHEGLGPLRQNYRDGLDILGGHAREDGSKLELPVRALSPFVRSIEANAASFPRPESLQRRLPATGWDDQGMPSITQTLGEIQINQAPGGGALTSNVDQGIGFANSATGMNPVFGSVPASFPLLTAPNPEVSKLRSRYAIEFTEVKSLGKGGYGRVYHVLNHVDGQEYAIKKIALTPKRFKKLNEGNAQENVEAILKEIRTLARLEHGNVVRYYSAWMEMEGEATAPNTPRRVASPLRALLQDSPGHVEDEPGLDTIFEGPNPILTESKEDDGIVFEESEHDPIETDEEDEEDETNEPPHEEAENPYMEIDGDDGIVFGETSASADSNQPPTPNERKPKDRRPSQVTVSSTISKKSTVHSTGPEDEEEDVEAIPRDTDFTSRGQTTTAGAADEDIFTDGYGERHSQLVADEKTFRGLTVILHIQMSLHPLSLATYLSPMPKAEGRGAYSLPEVAPTAQTLNTIVDRHCFHPIPSVRLMVAILDGVEYLHSQGIVHRDLKPGNIFLAESVTPSFNCVNVNGCSSCDTANEAPVYITPRIGDFGLVAEISATDPVPADAAHLSTLTSPGKPVGTEFYRPPLRTISVDEKLDVFALGVVLFELVWPFDTRMERHMVLADLGKGVLPSAFAEKAGVFGKALEKCILGMVRGDAGKRYGCAKVRRSLMKILAQERSG